MKETFFLIYLEHSNSWYFEFVKNYVIVNKIGNLEAVLSYLF